MIQFLHRYSNEDLKTRRSDLNGVKLTIDHEEERSSHLEISFKVLDMMQDSFNFTFEVKSFNKYKEMEDRLIENEADFSAAQMTHSDNRVEKLSPELTLTKVPIGVIFWKFPHESTNVSILIDTFDYKVWIAIGIFATLIFVLLHLAKTGDSEAQSIQNKCIQNGIVIVQALFGSSFDENALQGQRPSKSISIIVAILSLMGFTLFVCYTSTFTSSLATKELKIPFKSLKELSQHTSFKLRSFCDGTTITRLNKTISEDSKLANVYEKYVYPYCIRADESFEDDLKWFVDNRESKDIGMLFEIGYYEMMVKDYPEGKYI